MSIEATDISARRLSTDAATATAPERLAPAEQLRYAREIIRLEARALSTVAARLGASFCRAVDLVYGCRGSVIVTGIGKAGLIGQKIAATLASTGTRSHFLHPAEALHGDLGRIHGDDVVLVLSQSGETEEIVRLLPALAGLGVDVIAVTKQEDSSLGRAAAAVLELGPLTEACALGLAPSTTTTAMLAVGDALALVASRMRGFAKEDFARYHPGGTLGWRLSKVDDHVRPPAECRIALETRTVRDVLATPSRPGASRRRAGAILLVDRRGRLTGIFTDSDLARLFEGRDNDVLQRPVADVMTRSPITVPTGTMTTDAMAIMAERKISELPVVDAAGMPVGMLDITDLVHRDVMGAAAGAGVKDRGAAGQIAQTDQSTAAPTIPRPKMLGPVEPRSSAGT